MALFVPHRPSVLTFRLLVLALSMLFGVLLPGTEVPPIDGTTASMALDLAALPLQFIPNIGQTDSTVRFVAQHRESAVFFTANEVVLSLPAQAQQSHDHQRGNDRDSALSTLDSSVVRVQFDGANARPDIRGAAALPGRINYLQGKDPAQWRTDVPIYAGIVYQDLYAGIDLRYDGTMGRLKGAYTVAPGADPSVIRWRYAGATDVQLDAVTGALHISAPNRVQPLVERAPIVWQEQSGRQAPVTARYALQPDGSVGFALGAYDPALPLIIDPTLVYSTYLGGRQLDDIRGIAVDDAGNVYLTCLLYTSDAADE